MEPNVMTEYLNYEGPDGPVRAFLARPDTTERAPGLLVIQEVFGLTDHIEAMTKRFASEGYVALAPDLYSRDEVRKAITVGDIEDAIQVGYAADPESELTKLPAGRVDPVTTAFNWRAAQRQTTSFVPDLQAGLEVLSARAEVDPARIGTIGWCMGGGLNGQLISTGADVEAAVIYYGPVPPTDGIANIRCPVLGHYGGDDVGITSQVPAFAEAMAAAGKEFTFFVYEAAPHAFSNDQRQSYRPVAAALAYERTIEFLNRHLGASSAS